MRFKMLPLFLILLSAAPAALAATFNVGAGNTPWTALGGVPTSSDTINVQAGGRLTVDVGNAVCGTLNIGTASGAGTVGFVSGAKLTVTTLNVGGGGNSGSIDMSLGGTLSFGAITDTSTAGFIPGSGTVIVTGNVTLPSTAPYSTFNILNVASSTTKLGQTTIVSALHLGAITGTAGTLDLNAGNLMTNSISILGGGPNTITNSTGTTRDLLVNLPAGTLSYNSLITGNVKLVKDGPGTLSLSNSGNTYTGGTQVAGGTLQLGANNCLPPATTLTLGKENGATDGKGILDMNAFSQTVGNILTDGDGGTQNMVMNTSGNSQLTIAGASAVNFNGAISGAVSVIINSTNTVIFSGASNYSGSTSIQNGTLQMGAANVLPSGTTVVLGNGSNSGTLALAGFSQAIGGLGTSGTGANNTISTNTTAATLKVGAGGGSPMSVYAGKLLSGGGAGVLALEVDNNHTLILAGTGNTFGALNVISGTLQVGVAGAIPTTIPVTLGAGSTPGTLDINGFDVTIGQLSSSGSNNGNQIRDNTAPQPQMAKTLTTNITGTVSFAGQCTAKLSKTGAGTLTLTQSGAVSILNVLAGTVVCGAANIFNGSNTSITLGDGGTGGGQLNLNGNNQTIGTIGTSGTAGTSNGITSVAAATLTLQNTQPGQPFSFDGRISGAISVILNTSSGSPLTLAGSNNYTGTTTISNGSMIVSGSASSAFTLNSAVAGPLSGTGSVGALTAGNGAIVSPGSGSVGTLTAASANFSTGGILKIRIPSDSSSDKLQIVSSTMTLGGSSAIELDLNGYGPGLPASNVTIVDCGAGSVSGQFGLFNVINNTSGYAVNLDYSTPGKVIAVVGAIPVIANNAFPIANAGGNFNYNISASNSPFSYGATGLPPGINLIGSQLTGTPTTAGSYNVTLSATNKGGTGTLPMTLTVNPGPYSKLQVLLPGETAQPGTPNGKSGTPTDQDAGVSFNITVRSVDDFWNLVTSNANVSLTSNDTTATLPGSAALVGGVQIFTVNLKAASPRPAPLQPTMVQANDSDNSKQPGISSAITVKAGAFTRLQLIMPGETAVPGSATGKTGSPSFQTSDAAFNFTVNAVDDYFNVVSSNDFVQYSSSDPLAVYVAGDQLNNGTLNSFGRFRICPTQTLTVSDLTDGSKTSDTSPSITVVPGPYVRLLVLAPGEVSAPGTATGKSGTPTQQTSGTPFAVSIYPVDSFFNIRSANNTVKLTSSDPGAILPAPFTLQPGPPIPDLTLVTGPSQTVSAEDTIDATKNSLPSSPIPLSTITSSLTSISPDAAVLNGVAFELTVTGTNFLNTSVVRWNGSDRVTTFDSDTQLRAQILASDLLVEGRVNITVYSPPPGTGSTTASTFFVYSGLTTGSWVVTNTSNAGPGSLRLAMDSCRSGDTITFDSDVFDLTNADAATVISVSSELPALDDGNVTIDAQDRRVTINGSSAPSACGLVITSNSNTVYGLSIVSFPSSGVCIKGGAQSNIIGGNRKTGTGPNGQGLRIGNCGAFGVEIDGSGTSLNVVRACWLGLDASGTAGQPNLAGVLIKGGASNNTIGGTVDGEANVISGNTFEGVTISGSGTDDNIIIGNIVGAAAVVSAASSRGYSVSSRDDLLSGRGSVGNGTTGVFLSKGTNNSKVGGENSGEGNGIGNNGGNGVEVRATQSRRNSARSNGISKNRRGGIALFDGSNDGVTGPTFLSVTGTPKTSAAGSRSDFDTLIVGRASVNTGTVEVFADPDDQGSRLVGRAIVVNGDWQVTGSVTDLENITATFTDDNGNTSAFAFFGKVPTGGSGGGATDTDGDGISDVLELLAGTDPNNPADAPTAQGAIAAAKFSSGLNFAITGKDTIKTSLVLTLPADFAIPLATVGVQIDSVSKTGTLDAKGKSTSTTVALKMATKRNTTITTLTVGIKASDLRTGLTPSGMIDKTTATTGETLTVPLAVSLTANGGTTKYVYVGSASVLYKAVQGKRGKAALSR